MKWHISILKKVNYSGYFNKDIAGIKRGVPHTVPKLRRCVRRDADRLTACAKRGERIAGRAGTVRANDGIAALGVTFDELGEVDVEHDDQIDVARRTRNRHGVRQPFRLLGDA